MAVGFWKKLKKPFFVLAPMHDVTDTAFRQLVLRSGRPDVFFTEFVPVAGLCSAGNKKVLRYLKFSRKERPIVAQFFGSNPQQFLESARIAAKLGFDGIDINMGCSVSSVQRQGAGAALIKNPDLAVAIILAAKKGAGKIPVSVKTRIGYAKNEIQKWIPALLSAEPAAITLHGRTAKQGYAGEVDWKAIGEAVQLAKKTKTLIVGNGDVKSLTEAHSRVAESGCDGVMIGRAALRNPWIFDSKKTSISFQDRLDVLSQHLRIFQKTYPKSKNMAFFKKYIAGYISDFPEAKELRIGLMEAENPQELIEKIHKLALQKI